MVILAIGVKPDSQLARDAGLDLTSSGHIVVNRKMQTIDDHIFAVGDAVQVTSAITGQPCVLPLAGPANRQGRIAADVISGRYRTFRGVQGTAVCGLFDITLASTGLSEKQLANSNIDYTAIYAHPNDHVSYYPGASAISLKLIFDNQEGRVLGAQAVGKKGAERRIDVIAMAIQQGATVYDLEEAELCYAPQFGAAKDPVNILGMIGSNVMRGDLRITPWNEIGKEGSIVLDVRSLSEIAISPIVNLGKVKHIPLDDLRDRLDELNRDEAIHVSCAVGARANNAVRLLNHHAYNASLLPGGTLTLGCLNYCSDESCKTSATTPSSFDPLVVLHEAQSPLSALPLWLLRDVKQEGILKEYSLGQGESMTLKATAISDIVVLANGEVDVMIFDEVSRHLSSTESRRRPIKLSSHESKTFFARTPSTLYRIDQEFLDFYGSWFAMIESLAGDRPDLGTVLMTMRRPSVFINLPLTNVQQALKKMDIVEVKAGTEIITQGETPDNFYIIVDGEADVFQTDMFEDEADLVNQLKAGNHFGEDAFVIEGSRNATVKMTRNSKLLSLNGDDFKKLISQPLDDQVDHNTAKIQVDAGNKKLIDVRYEEEWYEERIPGATLIPLPELRARLDELDKNSDYIIYCHAGKRSAVADLILKSNGFKSCWMSAGIREWPFAVEKGL
jgi:rhodanese-related sulfurtransferase